MKIQYNKLPRILLTGILIILAIFIVKPGKTQNQSVKDQQNTMKIKVVTKKDGKTVVLDTTINRNTTMNSEEVKELVDNLQGDMKELETDMENQSMDIEMELSDSADADSLENQHHKVIIINKDGKQVKCNIRCCPQGFNYNYDFDMEIPEMPDCGMVWENSGSLNELLGNIPMERVKSYSIKERKRGKRITIDLDNGPLIETRDKTIIIREAPRPAHRQYRHGNPERDVKVIIRKE